MKLFARRSVILPTFAGWLLILVLTGILATVFIRGVGYFLSPNQPTGSGVLVIEGWMSQSQLDLAGSHLRDHDYDAVLTSGGPIKDWYTDHPTFAERAADELSELGVSAQAVPSPASAQNRTFLDAVIVRNWLAANETVVTHIDVVTVGVHARRSRYLYQLAFPDNVTVGVVALDPDDFDISAWWRTSEGAKTVGMEFIGWFRAVCCFFPPDQGSHEEMWGVYDVDIASEPGDNHEQTP